MKRSSAYRLFCQRELATLERVHNNAEEASETNNNYKTLGRKREGLRRRGQNCKRLRTRCAHMLADVGAQTGVKWNASRQRPLLF